MKEKRGPEKRASQDAIDALQHMVAHRAGLECRANAPRLRCLVPRLGCAFRISAAPTSEGRRNPPAPQIYPRYSICLLVPGERRWILQRLPEPRGGCNVVTACHYPAAARRVGGERGRYAGCGGLGCGF